MYTHSSIYIIYSIHIYIIQYTVYIYIYTHIYSRYITYENRPALSWALRQQRLEAPDLSDTSKMAAESRKDPGSASTASNGINTCISISIYSIYIYIIYIYAYLGKYPYLMSLMISYHLCFLSKCSARSY